MARVTVEDCVEKVPNRFDLVMLAAQRARAISSGASLSIERDNDKNPVVALREIADETVILDDLREQLVRGLQKTGDFDEPEFDESEEAELIASQQEDSGEASEAAEVDEDVLSIQGEDDGEAGGVELETESEEEPSSEEQL